MKSKKLARRPLSFDCLDGRQLLSASPNLLPSVAQTLTPNPVVNAGPDLTVTEGNQPNAIPLAGTFSGAESGSFTYSIFYVRRPDGRLIEDGGVFVDPVKQTLSYQAVQLTPGDYVISLEVHSGNGLGVDEMNLHVVPNNTSPQGLIVPGPADGVIDEGGVYSSIYGINDPGAGPWSVRISYGDSSPDTVINNIRTAGSFSLSHTYAQTSASRPDGRFHGRVSVTDACGATVNDYFTVNVQNLGPQVYAGPDVTVNQGQWPNVIPLTGSFADPGDEQFSSTFYVRRPDGSLVEDGGVMVDPVKHTLTYSAVQLPPGDYVVILEVSDGLATGSDTMNLKVLPQAPVVVAPNSGTINEGDHFNGSYSFTDSNGGPWTARIHFDDGSTDLVATGIQTPGQFYLSKYFTQDGTYRGTVTVTDSTGQSGTGNFNVYVRNVAPIVNAGNDVTVAVGQQPNSIAMTAGFRDPGADRWTANYFVRRSDNYFVQTGKINVDPYTHALSYNVSNLPVGDYVVLVQVNDGSDIGDAEVGLHIRPNPQAPAVVATTSGTINEGSTFNGGLVFCDPDGGPWNVSVQFGDGSKPLTFTGLPTPGTINFSHYFSQDSAAQPGGVYRGVVTVQDSTGLSTSANFTVLVNNVPPSIYTPSAVTVTYAGAYKSGVPLKIAFSDPGAETKFSAQYIVRRANGRIVDGGNVVVDPSGRLLSFKLKPLPAGKYTLTMSVRDDHAVATASSTLKVVPFSWRNRHSQLVSFLGRK